LVIDLMDAFDFIHESTRNVISIIHISVYYLYSLRHQRNYKINK